MIELFNTILVEPLLNLLVFFYNTLPGNLGVAIIALTLIIRALLAPSIFKTLKAQREMALLQPKLNEIREKYKNNKEEQAKAMMQLYQEHKVNPLASCLPILIQIPILLALYQVFVLGLRHGSLELYSFIHNPGDLNSIFLGFIDLSRPSWIFGLIAGIAQYVQSKMMLSQNQTTDPTAKALAIQTTYVFPVLTLLISLTLPAGLPLYWIVTTLFSIAQQYYIIKHNTVNT